eukprot:TRINITY_DN9245_c0_g1_i1.p1 TRINITY_DN9245_c0_g1~~TRINITY_DN9245_c0_g1_i1.p1  ORF type:complete len:990 (-),score=198.10 TRINITY_DN9245_c0_g1_i1:228-3197(-)
MTRYDDGAGPGGGKHGRSYGKGRQHGRGGGGYAGGGPSAGSRASRGSYPWINSQIISASETGDTGHLLATIEPLILQMNLVNLSTALHRLAKVSANDHTYNPDQLRRSPVIQDLLRAINDAFERLEAKEAHSQSLSNVAWSLATLRIADRSLVQAVSSLAVANISSFKPFELSTTLWSLTKLGNSDNMAWCTKPVFQAAASHIMKNVEMFGFRCLATTVWAFATAKQRHARLFRCIANQMMPMAGSANCQEMANTVWAFGTADFHNDQLFTELAKHALHKLEHFKPQELSNMLWGFATNNFFHEGFFYAAADLARRLDLQSQHLANILWAFARLRPRHPLTQETVLALMPACTQQLASFKPQEVSSTALAVAKAFASDGGLEGPSPDGSDLGAGDYGLLTDPQHLDLPLPVVQFFRAIVPWAVPKLHEFSTQSLANVAIAFVMLRRSDVAHEGQALLSAVASNVLNRCCSNGLEPTSMLHLLKGFAAAPSDQNSVSVVKALSSALMPRLKELRQQELHTLGRICGSVTSGRNCNSFPEVHSLYAAISTALKCAADGGGAEHASGAYDPYGHGIDDFQDLDILEKELPLPAGLPAGRQPAGSHRDPYATLSPHHSPHAAAGVPHWPHHGNGGMEPRTHYTGLPIDPAIIGTSLHHMKLGEQRHIDLSMIQDHYGFGPPGPPPQAPYYDPYGGKGYGKNGQGKNGQGKLPSRQLQADAAAGIWSRNMDMSMMSSIDESRPQNIRHPMYDMGYTKTMGLQQLPELGQKTASLNQAHTPYVDFHMAARTGHPDFLGFNWRLSVKNSFLHFDRSDNTSNGGLGSGMAGMSQAAAMLARAPRPRERERWNSNGEEDGQDEDDCMSVGSSQRSSSVPGRLDQIERDDEWDFSLRNTSGEVIVTGMGVKENLEHMDAAKASAALANHQASRQQHASRKSQKAGGKGNGGGGGGKGKGRGGGGGHHHDGNHHSHHHGGHHGGGHHGHGQYKSASTRTC